MGEKVEEIKRFIEESFPGLAKDENFKISSKATPNYNCIAWACKYNERWIQPPFLGRPNLDCVVWWPPEVEQGLSPDALIKLFENQGYTLCENRLHEEGFKKIAIYYKESTNEWTHASRELNNGFWTSKLGEFNDIQHSTPEGVENDVYGKVYCYMKIEL